MSLSALAFLFFYAGGLTMALGRHPVWGLVVYIGTFYLHPPARWWGESLPGVRWSLLAAMVTLVAYFVHSKKLYYNGSFFDKGIVRVIVLFTLWLTVQLAWAIDQEKHLELVILYWKYILLMYLFYRVIDTPRSLRLVMWIHVIGCFTMGWDAFTTYSGGRFEGFVPPNVNEANAGGLQLATGLFTAASLFLAGNFKVKAGITGLAVFVANGIVTTLSRSATLATATGGIIFNIFSPRKHRRLVVISTLVGALGFLALTNPTYWLRISTLKQAGEQVEGKDTGYGRVVLMKAQWQMFKANPFGCGHRCTASLSPYYLDEAFLTGGGDRKARSSHSTSMTMLVEHGIVGVFVYLYMLWWVFTQLLTLRKVAEYIDDFLALSVTATASVLGAIFIGDQFVDYLKLEVRLWFIGVLLVLPVLILRQSDPEKES